MIDSTIRSEMIASMSFAFAMLIVSLLGLIDIYFSSTEIKESIFGKIVMGGWILIGTVGIFIILSILSGKTISMYFLFLGLVITIVWISVERLLFKQCSDDFTTTTGELFISYINKIR